MTLTDHNHKADISYEEPTHEPVDIDLAEREAARELVRRRRSDPEAYPRATGWANVNRKHLFKTSTTPLDETTAVRLIEVGDDIADDRGVRELQQECWFTAENHGFHDVGQTFGDKLMLMVSELSEALEDFRAGHDPNETWFEGDEMIPKPCGIPSELADVFIRLVDTAECYDIDLMTIVAKKMAYNKTRPYLHGKTL